VHPLNGEVRYTCCNLRYDRGRVREDGDLRGTILPVGTRVRIDQVIKNRVAFTAEDVGVSLVLEFKGKPGYLSLDRYLAQVFLSDDPKPQLSRLPPKVTALIRQADIEVGMTKDAVVMSFGYPPVDLTPSLDAPNWRYRRGQGETSVYFDAEDKVVKIGPE
jgi:hypothetical protein